MGYWNTRGLRGSNLEEIINVTNENYRIKKLGLIQKIPTPITPVSIDKSKGIIIKAYFEQKSTVDYIGVVQGIAVCFDAKDTTRESLPIQNIHKHQIDFMKSFQDQKGISFLIVNFQKHNECFFLPFETLKIFWENSNNGGRKSIPYKEFDRNLIIQSKNGFLLHYLDPLNKYLVSIDF